MRSSVTARQGPAIVAIATMVAVVGVASGCSNSEGGGKGTAETLGELPDAIGELRSFEAVCEDRVDAGARPCPMTAFLDQAVADAAIASLSDAHGGAEALTGAYTTDEFDPIVQVYAVAGSSPGLWTPESDASAQRMSLGHPNEWVERDGDAECLVRAVNPVSEGQTVTDDNSVPTLCQAASADLTVIVRPGAVAVDDALAWTGEVFEGLS